MLESNAQHGIQMVRHWIPVPRVYFGCAGFAHYVYALKAPRFHPPKFSQKNWGWYDLLQYENQDQLSDGSILSQCATLTCFGQYFLSTIFLQSRNTDLELILAPCSKDLSKESHVPSQSPYTVQGLVSKDWTAYQRDTESKTREEI